MVGVLATLLFGLVVIYGETSGARGGAIVLIAISLALVAGGVFGLRRRRKPPEEPISIGAHLGGMLAGFALGHLFERGLTRRREPVFGG